MQIPLPLQFKFTLPFGCLSLGSSLSFRRSSQGLGNRCSGIHYSIPVQIDPYKCFRKIKKKKKMILLLKASENSIRWSSFCWTGACWRSSWTAFSEFRSEIELRKPLSACDVETPSPSCSSQASLNNKDNNVFQQIIYKRKSKNKKMGKNSSSLIEISKFSRRHSKFSNKFNLVKIQKNPWLLRTTVLNLIKQELNEYRLTKTRFLSSIITRSTKIITILTANQANQDEINAAIGKSRLKQPTIYEIRQYRYIYIYQTYIHINIEI